MRQKKLFRAPRKRKGVKFEPRFATKDCPRCENILSHSFIEEGHRVKLPSSRCEHKGRAYIINGFLQMILCRCCVNRMRKRAPGVSLKDAV
jgi:hypothetical protein